MTSRSTARCVSLPWLSVSLALVCVGLQLGGEEWGRWLAFQRLREEGWGMDALSGQWVHWGWGHALGNAAVLLACGAYIEPRIGRFRLATLSFVAWLAGALCLMIWARDLAEYRGASGIATCWLTLALIRLSRVRGAFARLALGAAVGLSFGLPVWLGYGSGVLPAGVRSVWELHLMAAVLAAVLAEKWRVPSAPTLR